MKIAVVGAGIAGLSCAWKLEQQLRATGAAGRHQVVLYEANDYLGGHSNTVDVHADSSAGRVCHGVDTGFLVFNERTYPNLCALFDELEVPVAASDMSFAVSAPGEDLEWAGSNLSTLFAQRRNLLRPGFLRMLRDIVRFNRLATQGGAGEFETLGSFLDRHGFSAEFRRWYFLPMIGSIWSCPVPQMLEFPVSTLIRFCHNHGLLQIAGRPQWRTVRGGSREYVQRMAAGLRDVRMEAVSSVRRGAAQPDGTARVAVTTARGTETFDHVVLACHSDQALALLQDASNQERTVLGAIRYQPNSAVLHTDATVLPKRPGLWSAWNYTATGQGETARVCVHYLINRLQPLPAAWKDRPIIVSLNPAIAPNEGSVLRRFEYAHPVFDLAAIAAQKELPALQGQWQTWFCGAWAGYGFHEDGLVSGLAVAERLLPQLAPDRMQAIHPVASEQA